MSLVNVDFSHFFCRFIAKQEGHWGELDLTSSAIVEILLPNETIVLRKSLRASLGDQDGSYQTFALEPSVESLTKLLAVAVDHIDTLLEDWYPALGVFQFKLAFVFIIAGVNNRQRSKMHASLQRNAIRPHV